MVRQPLARIFRTSMRLDIAGQELVFNSAAEIEFALAGRTDVPTKKVSQLVNLSPEELHAEARAIKNIERQFVELLTLSAESPGEIMAYLQKLDLHIFSQDHHWRDIMRSLRDKNQEYNEIRRIALQKYLQYLSSRQDVVKSAYKVKRRDQQRSSRATNSSDTTANGSKNKDTVIFDSAVIEQQIDDGNEFARLPKGEPIDCHLAVGRALNIRLSKHVFSLTNTPQGFVFSDGEKQRLALAARKNIVGRDAVCNYVVADQYRDVSRLHLVLDPVNDTKIRITDMSAHGTYLPAGAIN